MALRALRRNLSRALKPLPPSSSITSETYSLFTISNRQSPVSSTSANSPLSPTQTFFGNAICSRCFSSLGEEPHGPAPLNHSSMLQEDEYHRLANSTIHGLLENLEEYGDSVEIEGFDVDYGNEVLTLKLGDLGTYVINKQTPNRQIWMSSPISGPSRFDWDQDAQAWIYRRTKGNLNKILEAELEKLCGQPINLS
ncbi:frataxin, mitochondrial [Andrographis paniculata]|uniref:frataxin, mitochondrial n=1 Tax=Andrographis paniculata TaxID=175694 RepID=UPI0021E784A5|nr:frataxin, mitochondrial [Andrographis paniculata]